MDIQGLEVALVLLPASRRMSTRADLSCSKAPPERLLDLIYDAATEEELWTSALIQISDLTASIGGFVFGVENKARVVTFTFNGRMSEESHRVYRERHIINPWAAYMISSPVGKFVRSDEIMPLPALQRTAFFDELL